MKFVLDLEEQHASNKRKLPVSNPELAQHFLDGLDKDMADEFKDIKKAMCPKTMLKRNWNDLQASAKKARADTCCGRNRVAHNPQGQRLKYRISPWTPSPSVFDWSPTLVSGRKWSATTCYYFRTGEFQA